MGIEGLEDAVRWRHRQEAHHRWATSTWIPASPLSVMAHVAASKAIPGHAVDWSSIDDVVLAGWFERIDGWLDCADFDILRLLTLCFDAEGHMPDRIRAAIDRRLVDFRYWFTDPVEKAGTDERWYWSENHRLIFHTCEYLAGQLLPDMRFSVTGMAGSEHRARAADRLTAWFDEKAVDGFGEWHSDAYYAKDLAPLVTLAEFADDSAIAERASSFCDLVLYDLALHHHRGNVGSTHGRSYMKHKARAAAQPVFGAVKLCFDATDEPWPLPRHDPKDLLPLDESATLLARTTRYRPPAILRRIANSADEFVDRESIGIEIDPSEPLVEDPTRDDGLSYTDPEMVAFWWDRAALTPWQLIPLTIETIERHGLWETKLFSLFRGIRDALGSDPATWQSVAAELHPMVNAGLLSRVETYTWRNAHGMLSTAQAYRPGATGYQHHIWQATLDEEAIVFANHPGNPPSPHPGDYLDDDRYWTGSATLPRAVQHGRVCISSFEPAFAPPEGGLLAPFAYEPYTHAFFPTERFDEVRRDGHWTFGRKGDGYVALWSWRPPEWRRHDPATTYTAGLVGDFDLVAEGGADDVWIVELGDVGASGGFEDFCASIAAAEVTVDDPGWDAAGPHPGFAVRYDSPAEGVIESSPEASLVVDGSPVEIRHDHRFDNPYTSIRRGETTVPIVDGIGGWVIDLAAGTRGPIGS